MTMPEMQKAISRLRLFLASVTGKEEELEALSRQFRRQLQRAPNHAIHGGNSLDATLNIMSEIQERLDDVERTREHLIAIKKRAEAELQALDLTGKIEQAKNKVTALKLRITANGQGTPEELEEITALEHFIEDASIRAGRAITGDLESDESEGKHG